MLRVSVPPVGILTSLVCVTVTFPVGSKPLLSANSSAPNVTLVAPAGTVFGIVLLPSFKVTVAPGVTSVTVIPRFGRPPVFVTWSSAICGVFRLTLIVTGTNLSLRLPVAAPSGNVTLTFLVI